MPDPTLPLFIVEGRDVGVYETRERAQTHLEAIDVNSNVYSGYDASGRRLQLEADGDDITISLVETEPSASTELESLLRAYLEFEGETVVRDPGCDLPCLVSVSKKYAVPERGVMFAWLRRKLPRRKMRGK